MKGKNPLKRILSKIYLADLQSVSSELTKKIKAQAEDLAAVKARVTKIEKKTVKKLAAELAELKETMAKLESEHASKLAAELAPLNKTVAALKASVAKLEARGTVAKSGLSVAIMGVGGHGKKHIEAFMKLNDCHISHICDVDTKMGTAAAASVFKEKGYKPKLAQDLRTVLKDPSVDCVAIAAPHHWHALATIWALRAGKHVYVEKPVTHTFSEGPSVLAAARKYGKVVQSGTQLRSNTSLAAAGEFMRNGELGEIELVHCLIHKDRPAVPLSDKSSIPASVDFDLWCGPAETSEVLRSKFHYHWHWLWEFGNGALGNNGIHRIDAVRIALDLKGYGDLVLSCGGRFGPGDSGETPNNQLTLHKFGKIWVLQDVLGLLPKPYKGIENGIIFYGTKGNIVYQAGYATLHDLEGNQIRRFEGKQLNHYQNFLDAVRANDITAARGDLKEGIISSDLCHFGNISYRVGSPASDQEIADQIKDLGAPAFVLERLEALRSNLTDNGIDEAITLGRVLHLSDEGEPIRNDPEASTLLNRTYREPFVVPSPDQV